ncbi:MAG: hypothetical protein LBP82_00745 [Candidatus Methanoplasma sp.]|jgi:hypothetical protein|nr:hypothetical protein [Candidatus Methanoplasma sp.]
MAQNKLILLIAVLAVAAVAIVGVYVLTQSDNDGIEKEKIDITLTIETGFKVIYEGKALSSGVPFSVPKNTTEVPILIFTPTGNFLLLYHPVFEGSTVQSDGYDEAPGSESATYDAAISIHFPEYNIEGSVTDYTP